MQSQTRLEKIKESIRAIEDDYISKAAHIEDVARREETKQLIWSWATFAEVVAAFATGADISSYSIAGRSVTKSDYMALRRERDELMEKVELSLGIRNGRNMPLVADLSGAFL